MKKLDRDILTLAVPALGALVAEPLFLLVDTAMVGHLGGDALAGLGIASAILQTIVGLLIFLAYATTPTVARRLGAGDRPGAIRAGIDGMWLALLIGVALVVVGVPLSGGLIGLFGSSSAATEAGVTYLSISLWGIPAMLLVIAASGLLRGLQDTKTPLVVATAGFAANAVLNAVFIFGFGWGIAGSAAGTVVAQWGMAAVYVVIAVRAARRDDVSLRPGLAGVTSVAGSGTWLLVRTASLRAAMLATVFVASGMGVTEVATLQIAMTIFSTLAFILDALAIAGQAMIGHGLGAANVPRVTAITRRLIQHGLIAGVGLGVTIALLAPLLGPLFSNDDAIRAALTPTLWVMAIGVPLAGFVFVLDGVLIGAGDARYLALTGLVNLAMYAPLLLWVAIASDAGGGPGANAAAEMTWLWLAFGWGYMGARGLTLGLRVRTTRWIVTGTS
ncbi:MATE family efflux transporter [Homoserinimonas hongtaonis]|uniref:MATE family efflux transporter n=1 Tax=Homoserinimonas hongtaonis TaxID=2079791 RepID=UPI001F545877|nr:MATE family efflux transporter [Salinibacterium hongtaonis]